MALFRPSIRGRRSLDGCRVYQDSGHLETRESSPIQISELLCVCCDAVDSGDPLGLPLFRFFHHMVPGWSLLVSCCWSASIHGVHGIQLSLLRQTILQEICEIPRRFCGI